MAISFRRVLAATVAAGSAAAQLRGWDVCVAATPPRGFNTWNYVGCGVDEGVLRSAASAMHSRGMQAAGYQYVNTDDCWMLATRDAQGNQVPNPQKFPSGLESTIDFIHNLNLSFGLYTARAQHTCAGFAASCGYEAQDAANYASWGVDYVKDDNCGSCTDYLTDYGRMQNGLWAAGRPIVLSVEGDPDVHVITYGGYGNMKRVGHDISASWRSMMSLVDIGSRLFPYAHGCNNVSVGGWWNDLDMLEVGNGDFSNGNNMSVVHFSLWCMMKAPLLIGTNISTVDNASMAILTNSDALSIHGDALGVQGQRVAMFMPSNNSLVANSFDNVLVVSLCNASVPTQRWYQQPANTSGPPNLLYLQKCNANDPHQQWSFPGANGTPAPLMNVATGQCVDASAQFDPGMLTPCNGGSAQQWFFQASSNHTVSVNPQHCLDVYDFTGPDVEMGTCKAPGAQDSNQQWIWNAATKQIVSQSSNAYGLCLAATSGSGGSPLYTIGPDGTQWCVTGYGAEGSYGVVPCGQGNVPRGLNVIVQPVGGQSGQYTLSNGGGGFNANNQFGASGPWPHTRYVTGGGATWFLSGATLNTTGTSIQINNQQLINDPGVSTQNVTIGGNFCLDVTTMGMLEVWAAPLTNGRFSVALLNRSPGDDSITVDWSVLGVSPSSSFQVRDVWAATDRGVFTQSYSVVVASHSTVLLILTPA